MKLKTKPYREHPLYDVWKGMRARCNNKNHKSYKIYGGKGVRVCKEWDEFKPFYDWAIENGWKEGLQIDKDIVPAKLGVQANLYSPDMCCVISQKKNNQLKSNVKINQEVANIIRESKISNRSLGALYSLHPSTIGKIKNNKKWAI